MSSRATQSDGGARDRRGLDDDLCSADEEVRRLAVERLGGLRDGEMLPRLARALGDPSWRVRKAAVGRIAGVRDAGAAVGMLIEALADEEDSGRRNAALEALVRRGRDALARLVSALDSDDADVRKQLVDVIARIGDESAAPAMLQRLSDPDPNVGAAAADALGVLGGKDAVEALAVAALRADADPLLRLSALRALAALGADVDPDALAPLLGEPLLRPAVYTLLSHSSPAAAAVPLLQGLADRARSSRAAAVGACMDRLQRCEGAAAEAFEDQIRAFVRGHPQVIDAACAELGDADLSSRMMYVQLLGLAGDARAVVPILELAEDETLAELACAALARIGRASEESIEAAWDTLSMALRTIACRALGRTDGERGERLLLRALDAGDPALRSEAARSLGHRGAHGAVAALVRRLVALAADAEEACDEREALVQALTAVGAAQACAPRDASAATAIVAALEAAARGGPEALRLDAARIVGRVGAARELPLFERWARDPSAAVRAVAVAALGRLGAAGLHDDDALAAVSALQSLRIALADESAQVRCAAAAALAGFASEEVGADLAHLLNDPVVSVQGAALRALGTHGARVASQRETVLAQLERAPCEDGGVAIACAEALERIGGAQAAAAAVRLLDHEEPEVAQAAIACIAAHGEGESLGALLPLVSHAQWSVRADAIGALSRRRVVRAVPVILRRLEIEQDGFVRETMLAALRRLEA